ncbi:sugar ABC transporter ATP-binding protein [Aliagarivorans marinus]|uniref:sugar ABC transporter ATP-binding protein n=1 Tax=Aliagarivorans marinus TaxID=561965 RepID=UPI000415752D|nr:sugar ABC transporter ATP-binding protein [Aliagarivorans marinus]
MAAQPIEQALPTTRDSSATAFIELHEIHKRFGGVHALKGVSLNIEPGQIYHLLGENGCGKSTLIKVIAGAHPASSGHLKVNGETVSDFSSIKALSLGIETVYQDLSLLPNLTVAENIGLSQQLVKSNGKLYRKLDSAALIQTAKQALRIVELPVTPTFLNTQVDRLPIATRQLVAIARAVAGSAGLVIMDEPTTALTKSEVDNLIAVVRKLQAEGVAVLFVTHKLDECKEIGGIGLVMRDGELVCQCDIADLSKQRIGYLMTGREIEQGRYRAPQQAGERLLTVNQLGKTGAFSNVNFSLAKGEILGITGLLDSGRNELPKALAGVEPASEGTIQLNGRLLSLHQVDDAVKAGIGYVPEDRLTEGLFLDKPILDNAVMGILDKLRGQLGLIDKHRATEHTENMVNDLAVVASDVKAPVKSLSGGNQQKVLIGRWLATDPQLLILHGPTVGVDVGSKDTIYRIIQQQAESGMGVIIISDDLPELIQNCDRIAVMSDGRMKTIVPVEELTEQQLYTHIASGNKATQGVAL